jgi:hypothetical protein
MKKVTKAQAEFVLDEVAAWLGDKGHMDEHGGSVPTGPDAAYKGIGPELNMEWDWANAPSVILESGYAPYEWAIVCAHAIQKEIDQKGYPIYVEPYSSFALSIYPN